MSRRQFITGGRGKKTSYRGMKEESDIIYNVEQLFSIVQNLQDVQERLLANIDELNNQVATLNKKVESL